MLTGIFNDRDFQEALNVTQSTARDIKPVSRIVPRLVGQNHTKAAYDLVCTASPNRNLWLPEALVLFNIKGFSARQRNDMVRSVFSSDKSLGAKDVNALSVCGAHIGRLGFSFPQWRYIAQGFDGQPSLIESYGLKRLKRDTDVRDPNLPPYNPDRDEYGTGFVWSDDQQYVEYRRAYIVISDMSEGKPVTLIVRNSSHFFGRDRLSAPAYVSFTPFSGDALQNLDEDMLLNSGHFIAAQDIAGEDTGISLSEKLNRLQVALDSFDAFDARFSQWLRSANPIQDKSSLGNGEGGLGYLKAFLAYQLASRQVNAPAGAPFIVEHDPQMPPWFPEHVKPLDADLLNQSEKFFIGQKKMLLLSGSCGDLPIKPDQAHQADHFPAPTNNPA